MYKAHTIYDLNEFANKCGHFFCGEANNGYNCNHPNQEEQCDGEGCCFAWSCPLAYEAGQEDIEDDKIDSNGYTEIEEGSCVIPWEDSEEKEDDN